MNEGQHCVCEWSEDRSSAHGSKHAQPPLEGTHHMKALCLCAATRTANEARRPPRARGPWSVCVDLELLDAHLVHPEKKNQSKLPVCTDTTSVRLYARILYGYALT